MGGRFSSAVLSFNDLVGLLSFLCGTGWRRRSDHTGGALQARGWSVSRDYIATIITWSTRGHGVCWIACNLCCAFQPRNLAAWGPQRLWLWLQEKLSCHRIDLGGPSPLWVAPFWLSDPCLPWAGLSLSWVGGEVLCGHRRCGPGHKGILTLGITGSIYDGDIFAQGDLIPNCEEYNQKPGRWEQIPAVFLTGHGLWSTFSVWHAGQKSGLPNDFENYALHVAVTSWHLGCDSAKLALSWLCWPLIVCIFRQEGTPLHWTISWHWTAIFAGSITPRK